MNIRINIRMNIKLCNSTHVLLVQKSQMYSFTLQKYILVKSCIQYKVKQNTKCKQMWTASVMVKLLITVCFHDIVHHNVLPLNLALSLNTVFCIMLYSWSFLKITSAPEEIFGLTLFETFWQEKIALKCTDRLDSIVILSYIYFQINKNTP